MAAALDQIADFPALVEYLRDELEWPIPEDVGLEEATYDVTPQEIGLKAEAVGGGIEIKQLRPLNRAQPWGVFFLNLPSAKLPVTLVRNILGKLAVKKRASANTAQQAAFAKHDLLFIAATGSVGERRLAFAHFADDEVKGDAATLKVLGWDANDTPRRLGLTEASLKTKLHWPDDPADADRWRRQWGEAFAHSDTRAVVRDSKAIAKALAALARRIRERAKELIVAQTDAGSLVKLFNGFREALLHDLKPEGFADLYAQTISYGLLSAAIGRSSGALVQENIVDTVTITSPFLRDILGTFLKAGGRQGSRMDQAVDFDELGIAEVVELLRPPNTDMDAVLADFDRRKPGEDPVTHLYEDFMREYDPDQKVRRGVFYTPRPVVRFIVRSVDEALRTEFGLEDGLASTATWGELIAARPQIKLRKGAKEGDPFVRILDPATGTGTFLVECVDLIHRTMVAKWRMAGKRDPEIGELWNEYVPKHLLPRLTGFELMMAPYAIAHVKLGLKLADTGYRFRSEARAQIYLTNALEPARDLNMELAFINEALAREARAANAAKALRFTALVGNPPYSEKSANMQEFAKRHVDRFRVANGAKIRMRNALQHERNLNDDYVKFFGLALGMVDQGVIGLITNRYFLESNSLVGLREAIGNSPGKSWIVDLMGSAEEAQRVERLRGDENVFDIKQGVAVSVLARQPSVDGHQSWSDTLVGDRQAKYAWLAKALPGIGETAGAISPEGPGWALGRMAASDPDSFKIDAILPNFSTLVASNRDHLVVDFEKEAVVDKVTEVAQSELSDPLWSERFGITLKTNWNVRAARAQLSAVNVENYVETIEYRPFDRRKIFYHKTLVWQLAPVPSENLLGVDHNVALISLGKNRDERTNGFWVTSTLADKSVVSTRDNASGFPLWLKAQGTETRTLPNIAPAFANRVAAVTGLEWDDCIEEPKQGALGGILSKKPEQTAMFAKRRERGEPGKSFGPRDLFDYIYAILHSPAYRERFAAYLKSDFARIPLPGSRALFEALAALGTELVALHLLDADALPLLKDPKAVRLAGSGEARISMPASTFENDAFDNGRMYIAADQSRWFETVPTAAADFQVGGYQPARKWLKDRAAKGGKKAGPGRLLTDGDILHYRRIIVALTRTAELMPKIDVEIETHGGWPGAFRGMTDERGAE